MKFLSLLMIILLSGTVMMCDHGLAPVGEEKAKTGISGTIYYSNWLPADSIVLLKAVFFKSFPPQNIVQDVLSGNASTYPTALDEGLLLNVDSTYYEIELKADRYEYITVARQYGPDVFSQWRSVGQYNTHPGDSLPSPVTVIKDSMLQNIDIYVDFNNPPVQYIEAP